MMVGGKKGREDLVNFDCIVCSLNIILVKLFSRIPFYFIPNKKTHNQDLSSLYYC
jgi:hypothetical protein